MYFVLDLLCVLLIAFFVVRCFKASIGSVLMKTACVLFSALLAVFVSIPCASFANNLIVAPAMEKAAANSLADMVSAPHQKNGRETAKSLNLDDLVADKPAAFLDWVKRYHGDVDTVCFAYRSSDAQTMIVNLVSPLSHRASRGVSYVIIWIACFAVLRYFEWRLERNSAPKPRKRGEAKNVVPPLLGALYGICVVWGLTVALQWLVPPLAGRVPLITDEMLTKGAVYPILRACNPLYWLAQL